VALLTCFKLLDADLSKEVKKPPAVEFEIPKKIFTKYDAESGVEDRLVVRLVDFS
jgi:U3 small nucleolar RNA-associated protein 19